MTHSQKLKLARKMIKPDELRRRISVWGSDQWMKRKQAIWERIKRHLKK